MYSIYDYYGIKNDIDNRYTAGKQQGISSSDKRNAPFISMLTEQPTSSIANTGASELPSGETSSMYDSMGSREEDSKSLFTDQEIAEAWANYEGSPQQAQDIADFQAMGRAALDIGGYISGIMGGGKGLNTAIGLGKSLYDSPLVTGKNNWNTTGKNFLSNLVGAFVPNYGGKYGSQLGNKNILTSFLGGLVGSEVQGEVQRGLIERVIDRVTGKYSSNEPTMYDKTWENGSKFDLGAFNPEPSSPFKDMETTRYSETDPWDVAQRDISLLDDNYKSIADIYTQSLQENGNLAGGFNWGGYGGGPNDVPSDWSGYDWGDY